MRRAMLLLAVLAWTGALPARAARVDWAKARRVTIVAVDYRFTPNHLVFRRGVGYRLHAVNRGHELHELSAPSFFRAVKLRLPTALNRAHTELVLQPGEKKNVYFIAKRPGLYHMRCPDHDWAGMTGDITVK